MRLPCTLLYVFTPCVHMARTGYFLWVKVEKRMKPKAPCKDCEKREPGCHGRCEEYEAFKDKAFQYKVEMDEIHRKESYFYGNKKKKR